VETHVKVLAILHVVFGAFFLLAAILLMVTFGGASAIVGTAADPEDAAIALPIIGFTGIALSAFLLVLAVPGLFVGFGLWRFANWGRIGGIVLSALDLIHIPFGTILGIYGLWVLLNKDTEKLFLAKSAAPTAPSA
jgi:hypothetical protein